MQIMTAGKNSLISSDGRVFAVLGVFAIILGIFAFIYSILVVPVFKFGS